ncbi:MAG: hypothetical protein WCP28_05825 [Actinomycetes bacterium]
MVIALAVALRVMRINISDLSVAWSQGDLLSLYATAKSMIQNGWYTPNPYLGYPFVQDHTHFPLPDIFPLIQIKFWTLLTGNPFAGVNLLYLSGFPAVAGLTFALFRWLRMNRWIAVLLAISFAVLPWHFFRLGHTFFATYTALPIGLFAISVIASGRLDRSDGGRRWPLLALTIAATIIVGASGVYYALFMILLLAVVLVTQLITSRSLIASWRSLLVAAIMPVTVFVILLSIKLTSVTAADGTTVVRKIQQSVRFGGSISTLFTIGGGSRLGQNPFNSRLLKLAQHLGGEGLAQNNAVGVVAVTFTLVLALVVLAVTGRLPAWLRTIRKKASYWPALMVFAVLTFASAGLGAVFSAEVSAQIRGWGRMSIVIILVSLVTLGLAATPVLGRFRSKRAWLPPLIILPILAICLVDASTMKYRLDTVPGHAQAASMQAYMAQGVSQLGTDCAVLELPAAVYPEQGPILKMLDYNQLWPYLYSDGWKFSYGALRGTAEGNWAKTLSSSAPIKIKQAKAAGFCAIQISRSGFADPDSVVAEYRKLLGPPAASAANEWDLFSLAAVDPSPYTRSDVLEPVRAR